jgi:hypothetical protein
MESPDATAPFLKGLGDKIEPGLYQIDGTLRFQACSDDVCEPLQAIKFTLPLTIEASVPPAPKEIGLRHHQLVRDEQGKL